MGRSGFVGGGYRTRRTLVLLGIPIDSSSHHEYLLGSVFGIAYAFSGDRLILAIDAKSIGGRAIRRTQAQRKKKP